MLLRRITEHIKAQNWFAVGIDFVIVVVGVFIGIQVSNWNGIRIDRIDEGIFLGRLHDDIVRVEDSSSRVRARRIALIDDLRTAVETAFDTQKLRDLSDDECFAIATSHYYNINVLGLPSLDELTNSGRVEIIRDKDLSSALVEYQQRSDTLSEAVLLHTTMINNFVMLNPQLLQISPTFDARLGEFQTLARCDTDGIREDQTFLNALAENLDSYDAYLRDGLLPWNQQLLKIHQLVDAALAISHEGATK